MGEVVVVATMKAKAGKEREVEQALRGLVEPTHAEPGCVRYALHRALDDPTRLVLVERWRTREDLDEHFTQPHMRDLPDAGEYLDEPPQVYFCEALPTGDEQKGTI